MFHNKDVKNILEEYIRGGERRFAIYPFGDNGVLVKNLLKDYFNIEPVYIVDQKYSSYHSDIITLDELRSAHDTTCKIILTIEDWGLNWQMERQCLEYFDKSQIINLKRCITGSNEIIISKYLPKEYCKKAFDYSNVLGFLSNETYLKTESKIRVRIFHHGAHVWNAYETVCTAFKRDLRFDVLLILYHAEDYDKLRQQAAQSDISYVDFNEYVPSLDMPDIFIFASQFFASMVKNICAVAKVSFVIPVVMMLHASDQEESAKQTVTALEKVGVNYCLAEKPLYNRLPKNSSVSILEFGSPKFDVLYRMNLEKQITDKFKKLNGKRVMLFATSHGCRQGRFWEGITFDLYADLILEFVRENTNIGLVFRLHPLFVSELIKCGYWMEEDVAQIKEYMEHSENMVWDDNATYEEALKVTDVIITDGWCGMILSMLPLLRPICALYRDSHIVSICPEVDELLYAVKSKEELKQFLQQVVKNGEDRMYNDRKEGLGNVINHFDGKNGQRIKDFIMKVYYENNITDEPDMGRHGCPTV